MPNKNINPRREFEKSPCGDKDRNTSRIILITIICLGVFFVVEKYLRLVQEIQQLDVMNTPLAEIDFIQQ